MNKGQVQGQIKGRGLVSGFRVIVHDHTQGKDFELGSNASFHGNDS